jgi:hypothetical protein
LFDKMSLSRYLLVRNMLNLTIALFVVVSLFCCCSFGVVICAVYIDKHLIKHCLNYHFQNFILNWFIKQLEILISKERIYFTDMHGKHITYLMLYLMFFLIHFCMWYISHIYHKCYTVIQVMVIRQTVVLLPIGSYIIIIDCYLKLKEVWKIVSDEA